MEVCKFAHGNHELVILDEEKQAKYKCHFRVLTTCQQKRDICMYWHEEEAEFSLKSYGIKRNTFFKDKKILYGNPPFKKDENQINKLEK